MASTFPPQPVNTIGKATLVHMQPYLLTLTVLQIGMTLDSKSVKVRLQSCEGFAARERVP